MRISDWSSDVCSSDLDAVTLGVAEKVEYEADPNSAFPKYYSGEVIVELADGTELRQREHINRGASDRPLSSAEIIRSEERRVGKECVSTCSSRWSPYP